MVGKMFTSLVLISLLGFGFSTTSQAAMFDFVAEAAGNEGGLANGTTFTDDGVTVTVKAFNYQGGGAPVPYLDDLFLDRPAGLGVCQSLNGNECSPSSDDNITQGEVVELDFGQIVTITDASFTSADHFNLFDGPIAIIVDAIVNQASIDDPNNQYDPSPFMAQLTGQIFSFVANDSITGANNGKLNQLYINSLTANPVPVPSAFLLFATGLGALVGGRYLFSRRS